MKLHEVLLALGLFSLAGTATADPFTCRARVALNRVYDVAVDLDTKDMFVRNDAGSTFEGKASVSVSGRDGTAHYFLPIGFAAGIEVEFESVNPRDGRVALCLAANECYLCR